MKRWTGLFAALPTALFRSSPAAATRQQTSRRREKRCFLALEGLEARNLLSFAAPANFNVGKFPTDVVAADFNHDGKLDLATVNTGSNTVSVLLGNGDGTFKPAHNYRVGQSPVDLAIGDLNGDGTLDIVTVNTTPNSNTTGISVLLGNGDGTFQAAHTRIVAGGFPNSVALADINRDGKLDIVVANSFASNAVTVLLGNGNGTFQAPIKTAFGLVGAATVAVGDFNHDSTPDLVVVTNSPDSTAVVILLGNGNGTFRMRASYPVAEYSPSPRSVAVGDFNHDSNLDLAVLTNSDLCVFLGNGDGTFAPPTDYGKGNVLGHGGVTVADINGDHKPDLVVTGTFGVDVLLGNGDGTFQAPRDVTGYPGGSLAAVVGDFNGDGTVDVVVANTAGGDVTLFLGNGDGSFQTAPATPDPVVAVADLNGDGIADLVVTRSIGRSFSVGVALGNGDGTFQDPTNFVPVNIIVFSVAVADLDGDGIPDLVVAGINVPTPNPDVLVLRGNGDGTFQSPMAYPAGDNQTFVVTGDFNGDGIPDLAVANGGGPNVSTTINVLLGNGDGTFQAPVSYTVGPNPTAIAVADINGDGAQDLVVTYQGRRTPPLPGGVDVLLGNGDGTFQPATTFVSGFAATAVLAGDFNGDGAVDLAIADSTNGQVRVYLGNGDGSFQTPRHYAVGPNPSYLAQADINNDGRSDLVVAGTFGVRILTGHRNGSFSAPKISYGASTSFVAVADLNGDGLPDLITNSQILINQGGRPAPTRAGGPGHAADRTLRGEAAPLLSSHPALIVQSAAVRTDFPTEWDPARVQAFFAATPDQAWDIAWSRARPRSVLAEDAAWTTDETDLATTLASEFSVRRLKR